MWHILLSGDIELVLCWAQLVEEKRNICKLTDSHVRRYLMSQLAIWNDARCPQANWYWQTLCVHIYVNLLSPMAF